MVRGFITGNRNQPYLMPPSLNDWLPDDHPARFIHDTVRLMNLDCFYKEYSHEGSPPFEPGMMLCVLIYAYSKGMRSSRKIARACEDEVPFRWLTGNVFPNHSAICRFRTRHKENFKKVLFEVIRIGVGSGLVQLGNFYLDGTKVKAQASITENRKLDRIKQEIDDILAQAEQADQEEDKLYGSSRGDQLPKDLCDPRKRLARLKQAKARLDSEQDDSDEDPPAESGNKIKANITDPDSRIMKDRKGFVQGYNAQVVVTAEWDISCITHNIMKLFRQNARVLA